MSTTTVAKRKFWNPLTLVLGLSALFFCIFMLISGVLYFRSPSSSSGSGMTPGIFGTGSVGVVELNNVIMDSKKVIRQLEKFEEDGTIRAIVMRLNSPGGAVAPSQEIYEAVKRIKAKKPVVASMGSVAASGAYYIACGASKVYANAGTITGSIGVIMEFANLEKLYEWAKVRRYSIKTGKFKDAGAEYREMQPEERALLQGMVDDVLDQFKQAVVEGRKLPMSRVTELADGRIFSGRQAKAVKLVDELGTLQDAIKDAAKMAKLSGKPSVVYPDKPRQKLMELLMDNGSPDEEASLGILGRVIERIAGISLGGPAVHGMRTLEEQISGLSPGVYWIWRGAN